MNFQKNCCLMYKYRILDSESGAHNFYICSHDTHVQLWAAECNNWCCVAEPGSAAWDSMPGPDQCGRSLARQQPVAYAVGGQFRGAGHRLAGRAKWYDRIWLHAINPKLYTQ